MTGPAAAPIPCRKRQKTRPPIEEEIAHPKAAIVNTVHPASKAGRRPSRSHNGPKMSCPTPKPAMNKPRINAVAVGCARSEMPIFVRDPRCRPSEWGDEPSLKYMLRSVSNLRSRRRGIFPPIAITSQTPNPELRTPNSEP